MGKPFDLVTFLAEQREAARSDPDRDWEPEPPDPQPTDEMITCSMCVSAWPVPRRYYGAHVADHETNHVTEGLVAYATKELQEALAAASVQEKARAFATTAHECVVAIGAALKPPAA